LNSEIKTTVAEYQIDYYTIKDCKGKWIYAYREKDGKTLEGWLELIMECPNPLGIAKACAKPKINANLTRN